MARKSHHASGMRSPTLALQLDRLDEDEQHALANLLSARGFGAKGRRS